MNITAPPATAPAPATTLTNLDSLESGAVFILREPAAEFERPVLLFSDGTDSSILLRLAERAYRPASFPFPVAARVSERRATRADDTFSETAMEDRKIEGYF